MVVLAIFLFLLGCCVIIYPIPAIIVWGLFILVAIVRPILKRRLRKREEQELVDRLTWETNCRMKEEQRKAEEEQQRLELMRRMEEFLKAQEEKNDSQKTSNTNKQDQFTLDECYAFLGVSPNASVEEIKQAYRKIMAEFHPDKHGNYKEHYQEFSKKINQAYEEICRKRGI